MSPIKFQSFSHKSKKMFFYTTECNVLHNYNEANINVALLVQAAPITKRLLICSATSWSHMVGANASSWFWTVYNHFRWFLLNRHHGVLSTKNHFSPHGGPCLSAVCSIVFSTWLIPELRALGLTYQKMGGQPCLMRILAGQVGINSKSHAVELEWFCVGSYY